MRTMEKRTLEGTMNELGRIGRSSQKKIGRGGGEEGHQRTKMVAFKKDLWKKILSKSCKKKDTWEKILSKWTNVAHPKLLNVLNPHLKCGKS